MRFLSPPSFILAAWCLLKPLTVLADFDQDVWPFFEKHCVECHDDTTSKGGLDLYSAVSPEITGSSSADQWTVIFDRVGHGEMPPKKKARPDSGEIQAFLNWIRPNLIKADAANREVVHRRLNRIEYQNTITDLLGIEVQVAELLPEDQSAGGFDNNGDALAISPDLFERYLEAARLALDTVIQTGPKPETKTFTVESFKEVERYYGKGYDRIGDQIFRYTQTRGQYAKVSTRSQRIKIPGRYRFKFSAKTINTDSPVTFSVMASNFKTIYKTLDYYEADATSRTFQFEDLMGEDYAIQFMIQNLPWYVKSPSKTEHAGIGFGPVEITGPLIEAWPPESHQNLLGKVDLKKGELSDAETILRKFMPRAYRRPVTEQEVARPMRLVKSALESGRPFLDSLRLGLESVLCSPNFLFLKEKDNQGQPVSDYELASRLSFFLWNSMPDEELFRKAAQKELNQPDKLAAEMERILKDPRSSRFIENFTGQWLQLRKIADTTPDGKLYKEFDELLQISMVRESQSFFKKLITDDLPLTHFIDSDFAMLNRRLAKHYKLDPVEGIDMKAVSLPENSVRGGVLTQAAVLKVTANGTNTSPVMRGVWVLENILGKHIPPPPPNIEGIEPDIRKATTIREQLDLHRNSDSCASCHQYIDPPGFALESFDPIGAYRDHYLQFKVSNVEKGWGSVVKAKPVDATGKLASGESFDSIREFKALLMSNSDQFAKCLTEQLATYALGRELGFSDRDAIVAIVEKTKAEGNGFRTLIRNLVTSPLFSKP